MKRMIAICSFVMMSVMLLVAGCKKVDPLPYYNDGKPVTLTASRTSVTPMLADSNTKLLILNWSSPNYSTDTANYKFIIEIDSAGRNFSKAARREVIGRQTDSITGRELNAILLNNGFTIGTAYNLEMRVVSSYVNNNERYTSNAVRVAVTPFADPSVLTTQFTSVTGTAATSTNNANTFSWSRSFTGYSGSITYTLQYDSAGKNFASPKEVAAGTATSSRTLTQEEMNTTALNVGIAIGATGKVEYRLKATTANGAIAYSNMVAVNVTTFSPVPASLYIVGDATAGDWANPVPVPSQQFTKIDAYSFSLTIQLTAGKSYLFLPVNGSWNSKYGGATDGTAAGGGVLLKDGAVPGSNTPAPATSGIYKIVVNFQTNRYTLTPITVPANLFIVGDATPGAWANPVPVPSQQFSKIDNVSFGIVVNLTAGKSYLFLPVNGSWTNKFGGSTDGMATNGGVLLADNDVPGSNTPSPATSGLYKIIVNFATNSYTVTPYAGPANLFIVGDATPGGWNNPVPVPTQQFTKLKEGEFQLTIPLTAGNSYLFLPVNGSWANKFGGTSDGTSANGGVLLADGAVPGTNTPAPNTSGTRTINVSFITNTYKVQ